MRATIFTVFFMCLLHLSSFAQIDESKRYSEEQIALESKFVEASQLQLMSQYEKAAEKFKELIKETPDNPVLYFQLSRSLEALKDYDNAIKNALKAYTLNPQNEYFALQLAEVYEADLQFSKAAETYLSYTKVNKTEYFFYERSIFHYIQIKQYDDALEVLNKMEKVRGIREDIIKQKVEIYSKQGEDKKAIKELNKLIKAYPKRERYDIDLANYYLKKGEIAKAKVVFKDLLKKDPTNETALRFLSLSNTPASSDELAYLKAVSADIPNLSITIDQKITKMMPSLKSLMAKYDDNLSSELIKASKELTTIYPREAKAHAFLGDVLMKSSKYNEAVAAYEATLELNASIFDVWYQLMIAQKEVRHFSALLSTSEKALLRFPNQGIAYLFHGFALNALDRAEEAKSILEEGEDLAVANPNLMLNLKVEKIRSEFILGNYDKAANDLTDDLMKTAESYDLKGDIMFKQGKVDAAIILWKKALELSPDDNRIKTKITQRQL